MYVQPIPLKPLIRPRFSNGGKVVRLPRLAELAKGRSRANAGVAIASKLEQIMRSVRFGDLGQVIDLHRAQLSLNFTQVSGGTYFAVRHRELGAVMTGYINPVPRGRYAGGRLHPMTWKRGWEAALFDDGPWTETHRGMLELP